MEYWDLYDRNRKPLNKKHLRGEEFNADEYHIVVSIWTVNSKGQILLTLRDPNKEEHPDKWEVTAGSALSSESSLNAAVRELAEETGIEVEAKDLKLLGTFEGTNSIHDIYLTLKDVDIEDIVFQEGETVDARWASKDEFLCLMEAGDLAAPIGRRYKLIESEIIEYIK